MPHFLKGKGDLGSYLLKIKGDWGSYFLKIKGDLGSYFLKLQEILGRFGHINPPSHKAQRRLAGAISPVECTQGHYPPLSTRKPAASMCQVPSKHRSMSTKVRFVEAPVAISQVHRWGLYASQLQKGTQPGESRKAISFTCQKVRCMAAFTRRSTVSLAVHNNEPSMDCSISLCNTRHGIS